MRLRLLPHLLVPIGLVACGAESLSQSWQLDRLRILAVRAEPAEPRPGETVLFESLVYMPFGQELAGTVWFACLPDGADDFGCQIDPSIMESFSGDLEDLSPEEQLELLKQAQEAGLIGFEPGFSPRWTAPADALDGLSEQQQLEGVSAIVNISALPEGAKSESEVELAYKRLPISLASTPNQNPVVRRVLLQTLKGEEVEVVDGSFVVEPGTTYELTPLLDDSSVEDYVFVNSEGQEEQRTEEPYFTWYTEMGEFDQPFSLHPYLSVQWTAPDKAFSGLVVAVVRDRRGGMGWASIRVSTAVVE